MKELSIEEKAKRYDKAIKKAKSKIKNDKDHVLYEDDVIDIFPELKESENERIRKAIYNAIKYLETELSWDFLGDVDILDAYAWLEKQGQTFTKKDVDDAYLEGMCVAKHELEKQGEQKPAEWSEDNLPEFESYLCLMFQKFRTKGICTNGEIIDYVNEHSQKLKDILYHAWNEEDESMYVRTLGVLGKCYIGELPIEVEEELKWFKSIKDRVQPQFTWKPSDEQMDALNYVVNLMASSASPTHNDYYYNVFKDLRKQLKKLME